MKATITHEKNVYTFEFRAPRIFEETEFWAKFDEFDKLDTKQKADAEFEHLVTTIAEWSTQPVKVVPVDGGSEVTIKGDPGESVRKFFNNLDVGNAERIAQGLMLTMRERLQPNVVF